MPSTERGHVQTICMPCLDSVRLPHSLAVDPVRLQVFHRHDYRLCRLLGHNLLRKQTANLWAQTGGSKDALRPAQTSLLSTLHLHAAAVHSSQNCRW